MYLGLSGEGQWRAKRFMQLMKLSPCLCSPSSWPGLGMDAYLVPLLRTQYQSGNLCIIKFGLYNITFMTNPAVMHGLCAWWNSKSAVCCLLRLAPWCWLLHQNACNLSDTVNTHKVCKLVVLMVLVNGPEWSHFTHMLSFNLENIVALFVKELTISTLTPC